MHSRHERGSSLMLVPAGLLVLIALAAIAVDSSIAFMAQREMTNYAAGAANDAVTAAIGDDDLQRGRDARPNAQSAEDIVKSRIVGRQVGGYTIQAGDVSTDVVDDSVEVEIRGEVPYIFAPAIPGARSHVEVTARATAQLQFAD